MTRNIHIEIDEILLKGFDGIVDKNSLYDAVQQEIHQMISNSGVIRDSLGLGKNNNDAAPLDKLDGSNPKSIQISDIDIGSFDVFDGRNMKVTYDSRENSRFIGNQISQSIFRGLLAAQETKKK
jgi:hypothetical protein